MKTNILIFVIFLSLLNVSIFGQTHTDTVNKNSNKYKFALGFGGGYTTGKAQGFTAETWLSFKFMPNKFGIKTTFSPYMRESTIQMNLGLTFLYNLFTVEKTTLFLYQGNSFYYANDHYDPDIYYYLQDGKYKTFNPGLGLGINLIIFKRVELNFMFGYTFDDNFAEISRKGELGLFYKF